MGSRNGEGLFLDASQQPSRQGDDSPEELEDSANGNPNEPEREGQEPDYGVQKEGQQRKRPAQNQKDEPEQEFDHQRTSAFFMDNVLGLFNYIR